MSKHIQGLKRIKDRERALCALLDSFSENHVLKKAFEEKSPYSVALEATLRFELSFYGRYGGIYSLSESCREVALVIPSNKRRGTALKYRWAGCWSKTYKELVARLEQGEETRLELLRETEAMELELVLPKKYLYVGLLGVEKSFQGKGTGTELLKRITEEGERRSLPVILTANDTAKVSFYQELGFKVIGMMSSKKFKFVNIYLMKV